MTEVTIKEYTLKDDPISQVIYAYKALRGFKIDDREWDKRQWSRNAKAAVKVLKIFNNNLDATIHYMKTFASWANWKKITWRLETMEKCYDDWKLENGTN